MAYNLCREQRKAATQGSSCSCVCAGTTDSGCEEASKTLVKCTVHSFICTVENLLKCSEHQGSWLHHSVDSCH
eukprot:COSAG02_NODE_403_length_23058_cov_12.124134_11_plen_73_part_00